jgi:hypothetical protein
MSVKIIVDSTSDLTAAVRQRVHVVPLTIRFGDKEYIDGITINSREFYEKLVECDDLPTTSQATPASFEGIFRQTVEAGDDAVVITLASKLSGTYQSAVIAAEEYEGRIHVVDSTTVAIGGGILTELGFTPQGRLDYAIIGVGINVRQQPGDFPEDIRDMAGSLSMIAGSDIPQAKVAAAMMEALQEMSEKLLDRKKSILDDYRKNCITLHQDVVLIRADEKRYGHAIDIDEEGALIVRFADGRTEAVNSGEVSVRGMYGYV